MRDVTMGRANLEEFAATLEELARENPKILVVTSDSRGSGKLVPFGQHLPEQIVEVGIAEQNLVGVAAGLSSTGKKVFAVSPACFLTARSLEQIKNDVAYSDFPVVLVGISAGVSYGALGSTHHSTHDVAVLRTIPNLDVVVPADNFETREAVKAAAVSERPLFLKFGKKAMANLPGTEAGFSIGKVRRVRSGQDLLLLATGETVWPAYLAAQSLEKQGIGTELLSVHSMKPLDREAILAGAGSRRAVITVEEHSLNGGLGEAVATLLLEAGIHIPCPGGHPRRGHPHRIPAGHLPGLRHHPGGTGWTGPCNF
ncbi:MAG: transketolase C-terminal domain-containing protein [Bacteroidales bacterium]